MTNTLETIGVNDDVSPRTGLLGELEVELRLVKNGWHPVRLDTNQMAANADLLAVKKLKRVSIQIKTTDLAKQRPNSHWLFFGYSTGYLKNGTSFFNSKESPLVADVVIGVGYSDNASKMVVLPVAMAEKLCRFHADYWFNVPAKKRDTGLRGKRSHTFPIYMALTADQKPHREHHERIKRNIRRFEEAWEILGEPVTKLQDPGAWSIWE
jgi:hypothetical protein